MSTASQFTAPVYLYGAMRTPKGRVRRAGGTLSGVPSHELLGQVLTGLADRGLDPAAVDDLLIGTSTAAGDQGGNVARVAVAAAGWPDGLSAGVIGRLCCSGVDAIGSAAARVASGMADVVVAGGVESMSRVPMAADRPSFTVDESVADLTGYVTIGVSADLTAAEYGYQRADLDAAALRSQQRAAAHRPDQSTMVPVRSAGAVILDQDELARPATAEDLAALPALFGDDPGWERTAARLPGSPRPADGLHTVATAPQSADAAAAAIIGSAAAADALGRKPVAEILAVCQSAVRSPLLTAPLDAARRALSIAGMEAADLDVVEANESFAASVLLIERELGLSQDVVNPMGGAMSTGHPLGAGGPVLLANALSSLLRADGEYALITIPAALGLGCALLLRRLR